LHIEPQIGSAISQSLNAQGNTGGNGSFAVNNIRKVLLTYAYPAGSRGDSDAVV
jgi:hypothetical protein